MEAALRRNRLRKKPPPAIIDHARKKQIIMTDKTTSKRTRADGSSSTTPRESKARINPAFDDWLEKKLHNIFDTVAMEPVPKDLLKLLEKLDDVEEKQKKDKP